MLQKITKGILQREGEDKHNHKSKGMNKSCQMSRYTNEEWKKNQKVKKQ
jgi:hypothetical protein